MISAEDLIEEKTVLCGSSALAFAGLIMFNTTHYVIQTCEAVLHDSVFYFITLKYNPEIDYDYCVSKSPSNPMLLIPSKERALIECMKHIDWIDEGLLIEGLKNYLEQFWDEKLLLDAADHFKLPRKDLEYWLEEARNDYDE